MTNSNDNENIITNNESSKELKSQKNKKMILIKNLC